MRSRPVDEFAERWADQYPAIVGLWRSAWPEFLPFLDYDVEIRRIIRSTNAIESLNARYRRAVRARGHFPTEQAALKCPYLATRALDPTGRGRARWAIRWKPALNAFAITFEGRILPSKTNQPARPVTPKKIGHSRLEVTRLSGRRARDGRTSARSPPTADPIPGTTATTARDPRRPYGWRRQP